MTLSTVLYNFFSSFGLTAYRTTSVPDDVVFPYLTYEYKDGYLGDAEQNLTVSLWFHTESELVPDNKARQIGEAIGRGGTLLKCDDGAVWLKRGEPFCNVIAENDNLIKRRTINITIEFIK